MNVYWRDFKDPKHILFIAKTIDFETDFTLIGDEYLMSIFIQIHLSLELSLIQRISKQKNQTLYFFYRK